MPLREPTRQQPPRRVAAALRGIGTGEMQSLWAKLVELEMSVTVVVVSATSSS